MTHTIIRLRSQDGRRPRKFGSRVVLPLVPSAVALVVTCFAASAAADPASLPAVELGDHRADGDLQKVTVSLKVSGHLTSAVPPEDAKPATNVPGNVPLSVKSRLEYHERLQREDGSGWAAARSYRVARATMQIGKSPAVNTELPAEKARVLVTGEPPFRGVPASLSREEFDLLAVPGNSLHAPGLLPREPVVVGDTWQPAPEVWASLLHLDAVTVNESRVRLVDVSRGLARVQIGGSVLGHAGGAATQIQLEGDLRFDMEWQRVHWLQLVIQEQREASPIRAGFSLRAEVRMLLEPLDTSPLQAPDAQELFAESLQRPPRIQFFSSGAGCRLEHGPQWYVVDDRGGAALLRFVEGGVATLQCSLQRLESEAANAGALVGRPISLQAFQRDIQRALEDRLEEVTAAKTYTRSDGYRILEVIARGTSDAVPVRWAYYHLLSPQGDAMTCIFTMEEKAVETFAREGKPLLRRLELLPASRPVASSPGRRR